MCKFDYLVILLVHFMNETQDSIFDQKSYRAALKLRMQVLRRKEDLSFRKIADNIRVQSTFLSRAMNRDDVHLNEDHFFAVLQFLRFSEPETDYLLALRAYEMALNQKRKDFFRKKLEQLQLQHSLKGTQSELGKIKPSDELSYMLNPLGVLVYVSLHLKHFLEKPKFLISALGISEEKLKEILGQLRSLGYIETGTSSFQITKLVRVPLHYNKTHPLMRAHQQILKTMCSAQVLKLSESEKTNFMITLTGDNETFEEIQKEFMRFVERVQKISQTKKSHKEVYQMNFDLFKWISATSPYL